MQSLHKPSARSAAAKPVVAVFSAAMALAACVSSSTPDDEPALAAAHAGMVHTQQDTAIPADSPIIELAALRSMDAIVAGLDGNRVVYVGETHDRYDHHLNQLEVLRRWHRRNPKLAIGVEWFQQPYQEYLDDYVAGRIEEAEMLRRTEYFSRWRYDIRLYRPILEYAREHRLPIIALNVPAEVTSKVGREGLDALSAEERAWVPQDIDRSDAAYRERIRTVFRQHPGNRDFEKFESVQLIWDEGMAQRAARYLSEHPDRSMVVFAGSGHIAYGSGIPNRVARRVGGRHSIVISATGAAPDPAMGDYLILSATRRLPPSGKLGAYLEDTEAGVRITRFSTRSAAKRAGLKQDDRIVSIAGRPVREFADIKIILTEHKPGDTVSLGYRRDGLLSGDTDRSVEVVLR